MNQKQWSNLGSDEHLAELLVFGKSGAMKALRETIPLVAVSTVPVLIMGEEGAGKEIIARSIHNLSPRVPRSKFVAIDCAADDPFENECFAPIPTGTKPSYRIAVENGGTLFLNHVDELNHRSQTKLLQLMRNGTLDPLESPYKRTVAARLICASTKDPKVELEKGNIPRELYYRINVVTLRVPPLRERPKDIAPLVQHFIEFFNEKFGYEAKPLSSELMTAVKAYGWPGNLREMADLLKRYVILGSEDVLAGELGLKDQERRVRAKLATITADHSLSLKKLTNVMVKHIEYCTIMRVLETHNGNTKATATALNMHYRTLANKVRQLRTEKTLTPTLQNKLIALLGELLEADMSLQPARSDRKPAPEQQCDQQAD